MKKIVISISLILMISGSLLAEDAITINETGNVVIQNPVEMQSIVKIQYNKDGKGSVSLTLQDILRQLTPPGSIQPYGGTTAPEGWLLCNGDSVSQDDYPDLFDVIGTNFGTDGSGNFNLPDLRGMFLRGKNDGATIEVNYNGTVVTEPVDKDADIRISLKPGGASNDAVGSYQGDAIRNITGYARVATMSRTAVPPFSYGTNYGDSFDTSSGNRYDSLLHFNAASQVPTGADNRPRNVSVNYIIKY